MNVMPVHSFAAEARKQGRVDIHHPPLPLFRNVEQTEPAGQADQIDAGVIDEVKHAPAEGCDVAILPAIDDLGWEIGALRTFDPRHTCSGGNDELDAGI